MSFLEPDGTFKWGKMLKILSDGSQLYESFVYKRVEYLLYDCVYTLHEHNTETSIGKIVKMSESPKEGKKLVVLWFYRPKDIINHLKTEPCWNELFLPCGKGEDLFDSVEVGLVLGKCNVICTSEDKRNPPVSDLDAKRAGYFFSSTFDARTRKISKCFPDAIDKYKKKFLNRRRTENAVTNRLQRREVRLDDSRFSESMGKKAEIANSHSAKPVKAFQKPKDVSYKEGRSEAVYEPLKKRATTEKDGFSKTSRCPGDVRPTTSMAGLPLKRKSLLHEDAEDMEMARQQRIKQAKVPVQKEYKRDAPDGIGTSTVNRELTHGTKKLNTGDSASRKAENKVMEVTKKPPSEKEIWFRQEPWEDRLQTAYKNGKLVFLSNLDPSYTSSEVEDMIWTVFRARTAARVIPHVAHSSPHYGQAFAIFHEQKTADSFITKLTRTNLMQVEGRPLIASRKAPVKASNSCDFPGHLVIDDLKLKRSEVQQNAVSTSHCAQDNTMEFDFAMEWMVLQGKFAFQWKGLYEKHEKDRQELLKQLKHVPRMT